MGLVSLYKGVEVKLVGRITSRISYSLGITHAPLPSAIYLIVNSRCNLKCLMCDVGISAQGTQFWQNMISDGDLEPQLAKRLLDEVSSFRPLLAITSTEPLLYGPLPEIITYASKFGMKTQVTTNGLLLEKKAEDIIKAGLTSLWVSIDGPEPVHDIVRGVKWSFKKAIGGLKRVFDHRPESRLEEIGINCTISPINQGYLLELFNVLADLPLDVVCLSHMNFITGDMAVRHNKRFSHICKALPTCVGEIDSASVDVDLLWAQLKEIKSRRWPFRIRFTPDLHSKELVEIYYKAPEKIVARNNCRIPWDQAQIAANGDLIIMTRCFHLPMGNISESSFKELWNSDRMRSFRRAVYKVGMFPACTRCCGVL